MSIPLSKQDEAGRLFAESAAIMARLRAPDGCPWDKEQTLESIRKYTLEEAYEVFDAIERNNRAELADELGDLLLQVLFYAQIADDEGSFDIRDVLMALNRKLVRRHPHVFGEEASRAAGNEAKISTQVDGSAQKVVANWDAIKAAEKKTTGPASLLDSVLRSTPALLEAAKLGSKAAKSGFDWPDWRGLLPKVEEETAELAAEAEAVGQDPARQAAVEAELGDLLFTVVNLGRHLHADAEMALRGTNRRFRERFAEMERCTKVPLDELSGEELEALWTQAKKTLQAKEK